TISHEGQPVQPSAAPPRRFQHNNYTVAIIYPIGPVLSPNAYKLGRIGEHNIIVAAILTIGNNAAAIVVTQLLNDFDRVRFGLLVGISGGIPNKDYKDDDLRNIRLRDVIVNEVREGFSGIV
ncbi:hypothetical protein PG996_012090, partial [Apiospora saccharicola]